MIYYVQFLYSTKTRYFNRGVYPKVKFDVWQIENQPQSAVGYKKDFGNRQEVGNHLCMSITEEMKMD